MGRRYETVSLLTDYGLVDEFVGVLKSVVRDLAPHVHTVDLTHSIAAYDVRAGSLALARAIQYVAEGVVVAVVDPGVGTDRRAIAVEVAGGAGVLIGPDNGLLAPAVAMAGGAGRCVVLTNTEYHLPAPGATFAGRDIFAPVAAHLCNGVDLAELGDPIDPNSLLPGVIPISRDEDGELIAEVLWVDHYGNCQLNVSPDDVDPLGDPIRVRFTPGGVRSAQGMNVATTRTARRASSFGALGEGTVGLVTDSYGMIAICVDRGSAALELGLDVGTAVMLSTVDDDEPKGVSTPLAAPRRRD
jgi:S-adenosyl-L-methionine hydrolase (adenosine-forming)